MLGHGLAQLGDACQRASRVDEAIRHFDDALRLWRGLGDRWGEVRGIHALARGATAGGRTDDVRELLTEALDIMESTGYLAVDEAEATEIRVLLAEVG
jgi:hypothetical protein